MTTFTSPHNLPIIEPTVDRIKDGAESSALAGDINAVSLATNSAITAAMAQAVTDASFIKPMVNSGVDLNTLTTPGAYPIRFASNPNGVNASGFLIVGDSANGTISQITQLMMTQGAGMYYRSARDGVWEPWGTGSSDYLQLSSPVSTSADLLTITTPGIYPVSGTANINGLALPGTLYVNNAGNTSLDLISQMFIATDGGGIYYRSARNGVWTDWAESGAPKDVADKGSARHEVLLSEALRRRGGKIGTAGRGVVSLRFDHHLDTFKTQILPLLKQYKLPWSQAVNSNSPFSDDTMPFSELQSTCINSGGEVWNHGYGHGDATTPAALRREIVTSLGNLSSAMPELAIEGFAPPGLADGGYNGTAPFRTAEQWNTNAARMIIANHAFISGYMGSHYRPLGGTPVIGHSHYTMDNANAGHWSNAVNKAIATGTGVAFMLHPSAVADGQTTTAVLNTAFANIAAKRDAGELVVLSPSGSLVADAGSSFRRNLLGKSSFTAGETLTLNLDSAGGSYPLDFRGALHEIVVSGAGTITVTSNLGGLNASVSSAVAKPQRLIFNVPLSATTLTITSSAAQSSATLTAI